MTSSISENDETAEVDVPHSWDRRLKQLLEGTDPNIQVCENETVDGIQVPIKVSLMVDDEQHTKRDDDLIKRNRVLWQILGDDEPVEANEMNACKSTEMDAFAYWSSTIDASVRMKNDIKDKQKFTLVFPRNRTSMCFTELKFENGSIQLGHVSDQQPSTDVLMVEQLKRCGHNVVVIEEMEFVKAENSERELSCLLTKIIPKGKESWLNGSSL